MTKVCLNCLRSDVVFPLARPRKNGVRFPMSYCRECLSLGHTLKHGGREAVERASRGHRSRSRAGLHAVFGPAPCHHCHDDLWFDGKSWRDVDGHRHVCQVAA